LLGWSVLELDVDVSAGTGLASFRSGSGRLVRVIADERGAFVERLQERPASAGAAPNDWRTTSAQPLSDLLGRSKVPSLPVAMRDAGRYMVENMDRPLSSESTVKLRRRIGDLLADGVVRPAPELGPRPRPSDLPDAGPLAFEYVTLCWGTDPGPMVRSQGRVAVGGVRGFAASGLIVDGRGLAREARFEVVPFATARRRGKHAPLVAVAAWRASAFVDGWSWATLECGHEVEHRTSARPKRKRCHECWVAALRS
jgi:hypothetical protein